MTVTLGAWIGWGVLVWCVLAVPAAFFVARAIGHRDDPVPPPENNP